MDLEFPEAQHMPNGCLENSMLFIVSAVAFFVSSHSIVPHSTPVENPILINCIILGSSLHFAARALGERSGSLAAIALAILVSLLDVLLAGSVAVFVPYLITVCIAVVAFSMAVRDTIHPVGQNVTRMKVFIFRTSVLKQLLNSDTVPINPNSSLHMLHLHTAFFSASFILLVMALWLQINGVHLLNPLRRATYSLDRSNRPSVFATILHWTGAVFFTAYVILTTIISSSMIPIVYKVAGAISSLVLLFKP